MERPPQRSSEPADERDERDRSADPDEGDVRQADLLSVALLVFFVSLIGVVGALLLLPVLL